MHAMGQMQKYLAYLSYVGSEFRGIQKQLPNLQSGQMRTVKTVQEELEAAIHFAFKPHHTVDVFTSSRTDSGVHALRTTVHFKLQRERDVIEKKITSELNKHFVGNGTSIRVQSIHKVPSWFSSRNNAIFRTYLYRFAVLKEKNDTQFKYIDNIPYSEHGRTLFIQNTDTDVSKMQEVARLFEGTKDFLCFMGKPKKQPAYQTTIRSIYSVDIYPSQPFMPRDPHAHLYDYWDVVCQGRSFVYRQIRRMIAVMLAVSRGAMTIEEVEHMLTKPNVDSWNPRAVCAPPWALYLLDVSYNPLHLNPQYWQDHDPVSPACAEEDLRATYALY